MPRTIKILYARYLIQRMAHRKIPLHQVIDTMQAAETMPPVPVPVLTRRLMLIITLCTTWVIAAALTGASYGLPHALLLIPAFAVWVFGVVYMRYLSITNQMSLVLL